MIQSENFVLSVYKVINTDPDINMTNGYIIIEHMEEDGKSTLIDLKAETAAKLSHELIRAIREYRLDDMFQEPVIDISEISGIWEHNLSCQCPHCQYEFEARNEMSEKDNLELHPVSEHNLRIDIKCPKCSKNLRIITTEHVCH